MSKRTHITAAIICFALFCFWPAVSALLYVWLLGAAAFSIVGVYGK